MIELGLKFAAGGHESSEPFNDGGLLGTGWEWNQEFCQIWKLDVRLTCPLVGDRLNLGLIVSKHHKNKNKIGSFTIATILLLRSTNRGPDLERNPFTGRSLGAQLQKTVATMTIPINCLYFRCSNFALNYV